MAAGSRIRQASPHLLQLSQEGSKQMVGPRCLNVLSASTPKASFFVHFLSKHEQLQEFQDLEQNEDVRRSFKKHSEFQASSVLAREGAGCGSVGASGENPHGRRSSRKRLRRPRPRELRAFFSCMAWQAYF